MAEPPAEPGLTLTTSLGSFSLAEEVTYPNGGRSRYYTLGSTAIVIDYDICQVSHNQPAFDYSLITSKQNGYVAKYDRVYRFVSEDVGDIERFLYGQPHAIEHGPCGRHWRGGHVPLAIYSHWHGIHEGPKEDLDCHDTYVRRVWRDASNKHFGLSRCRVDHPTSDGVNVYRSLFLRNLP